MATLEPSPREPGGLASPEAERALVLGAADLRVKSLGPCRFESPVAARVGAGVVQPVGAADRVLLDDQHSRLRDARLGLADLPSFELAGPRDRLFFEPARLRAGIVTCGGLCPGINNVIRGLVLELAHEYGCQEILGFRYGFEGLTRHGRAPVPLGPDAVAGIHERGGTVLGTSRGKQDPAEMVDTLERLGIGALFVIGGDGTLRGAMAMVAEIERRGLAISVVGIPKTIDNDIYFIDRSFGFESACVAAVDVLRCAHAEATGARNGIGLVKVMGRHSGFIACAAALASTEVNFVLIPEVPLVMDGPSGFLPSLERRLAQREHAVVLVAEGAGQQLFQAAAGGNGAPRTDASGNVRLGDIGVFLRDSINQHFRELGTEVTLKYIDPSYQIRSVPASPSDSMFCGNLARSAVHAAMAGHTELLIGRWHGRSVHVPMSIATRVRKQVDVSDELWASVIEVTGQPARFA